ncbi:MAG: hypothetical protein ABIR29_08755, partial [Chthoniobacterales bacterium]
NKDLGGIAQNGKAWGLYANGTGFEQAVAFRALTTPLAPGNSFSFMLETGPFEKKSEGDPGDGSAGLTLRTSNAAESPADYGKDAVFQFGHYDGKPNYQVRDGSGDDKADTGVAFTDAGVSVTVTITGPDTYDLEIQDMSDKKLTKLPGRKLRAAGAISSLAIFNRNSEKNDVFFNGLQVAREME